MGTVESPAVNGRVRVPVCPPLWSSEKSMHRWSPQCALGWLQAELEEAEQEAEVRGRGGLGPGEQGGEPNPVPLVGGPPPRSPPGLPKQNFLDS